MKEGGPGMETLLVAATAVGLASLVCGLIGLAAGRLDPLVISTRPRAAVLAAAGLALLFTGSAPPIKAGPLRHSLPDTRPPVPVRAALLSAEAAAVPKASGFAPFPEQAEALSTWAEQLLSAYEDAEKALHAVPAVLDGLRSSRVDRFTAWVHLGRYSQDIKQAHLALHDLTPPGILDLAHQKQLQVALDSFHYSLASKRAAVSALQVYARTLRPEQLATARAHLADGEAHLARGLAGLAQVKAELGLAANSPAPAFATGPPAGR